MTHPTSLLVHPFGAEPCELSSVTYSTDPTAHPIFSIAVTSLGTSPALPKSASESSSPASSNPSLPGGWRGEVETIDHYAWVVVDGVTLYLARDLTWGQWDERHPSNYTHPTRDATIAALAAAEPWPGYVEPKPASDGTVDAAFVAANAGEYDGDNGNKYRSDGAGSVLVVSRDTGAVACQWRGADRHAATRFLPLPKPESKPAAMPGEGERIKRYLPWPQGGMALSDDGDYVKHSDHLSSLAAARAEVERMRAERDEARRAGADAYAQSVKVQGWMSEETDKNGKLRSDLAALKVRVDELGVIVDKARALARHSNYHQEAPGSLERALHDALLRSFTSPSNPHPLALNERKSYAVPDQVQLLRKSPL